MADARSGRALAIVIAVLVVSNVATNVVLPQWADVAWNVLVGLGLVVGVRWAGVTITDLGLDRAALARGWRAGRWFVLATGVVLGVALAIPATRELLEDDRVRTFGFGLTLYHAVIAVPFGTVLLEEVAFRGILPALGERWTARPRAVALAAILFGLWHVLPAWDIHEVNPVARDLLGGTAGRAVAVIGGVVFTALVGGLFWWVRDRTRSLYTPMFVHVATNSLGYLAAYVAWEVRQCGAHSAPH